MKNTRFSRLLLGTLIATLALFVPTHAQQTTLTATTISAAQTATARSVTLASATGVAAGYGLFIDGEEEVVISISGTVAQVARGVDGTNTSSHLSGSAVYVAAPGNAYFNVPVGSCTRNNENALPHVTATGGSVSIYDCLGGQWVRSTLNGLPSSVPSQLVGGVGTAGTYTANGAITVAPGVSFINGTTLAMTLAAPTIAQNGWIMIIESTNASAQTVTNTAGFNGGTTARDVATYGGAIGDNMVIVAVNGVWWVISTRNVTFG